MAKDYTICIGTVGQGLWQSPDGGETWQRMRQPFPLESRVRALALHPTEAHTLFAGADSGVYRSRDTGASWERVSAPEAHLNIWSLAIDPSNPETIFAGTSPSAVYRSQDGGHHWEQLHIAQHFPAPYCRWIAVKPDAPQVIFAACGDSAIGSSGNLQRSTDGGQSWQTLPLPVEPNSPLYGFAVNAAHPDRILSYSLFGEIYASEDAGDSWQKVKREFGEIRSIAWQAN